MRLEACYWIFSHSRLRYGGSNMVELRDILGHEDVKKQLENAVVSNKVSHAYLFSGDNGSGKKTVAKAFAKVLLCEEGKEVACGKCKSCKQVESNNNPDLKIVTGEKVILTKDEIRSQIVDDAQIKPYSSKRKVYIIPNAHLLRTDAQNVLLKTIEEPPTYVTVILVADNDDAIISTIMSRCVKVKFKALKEDIIKKYLMENCGMVDYAAQVSAAFSGGSLGRAIRYSTTDDFVKMKELVVKVMRGLDDKEVYEIMYELGDIVKDKLLLEDYLDLMLLWFRDVLMLKVTNDPNKVLYKDEYKTLKSQAKVRGYDGIDVIIKAIDNTRTRLKANVNMETAIELLVLTMKNPIV